MTIVSMFGMSVPSVKISPERQGKASLSAKKRHHLATVPDADHPQLTSTGNSCALKLSMSAFRSRSAVFAETHRASIPRDLNIWVRSSTCARSTQKTKVDFRSAVLEACSASCTLPFFRVILNPRGFTYLPYPTTI